MCGVGEYVHRCGVMCTGVDEWICGGGERLHVGGLGCQRDVVVHSIMSEYACAYEHLLLLLLIISTISHLLLYHSYYGILMWT